MIYVIGIGPGGVGEITPKALKALNDCNIIMGYAKYIELVKNFVANKKFISYPMKKELERCNDALKFSLEGKNIALVSGGDPGVYGMAGLMLEIAAGKTEVQIISGIPAANSCAAILGAPLMNDYAAISLSDLMTPWEVISQRLIYACKGDFVICIYNPASRTRPEHFKRACEIMLEYKSPDTPAGFVSNAGRSNEYYQISTLGEIKDSELIDMFCTVIIGNSKTFVSDGKIITPRGYKL